MIGALVERVMARVDRSGRSTALEALEAERETELVPQESEAVGRRQRPLAEPRAGLDRVLGQKVLHGWLQNRHQTLFPLSVNLRHMDEADAVLVAMMGVIAALSGGGDPGAAAARLRGWLASVGGSAPVLQAFDEAQHRPPALSTTLQEVQARGLGAHGYVAALIGVGGHDPSAAPFLGYLEARLALPPTLVRSAHRRYAR
jgi:hypothetical protein